MLKNILIVLLLLNTIIYANDNNSSKELKHLYTDKFELLSKDMDNTIYSIKAKGNVFLVTSKYYILADELIFFKDSKIAEVYGNVVVIQNGVSQLVSDYAYFDFKNDVKLISPIFLLDNETNLWINSKRIEMNLDEYIFDTSTISSCDCIDPAWSMRVSSASHDNANQWMHLFNMRLYIGDVPIFYLPYFGYPTDNTRRSGILPPTIGTSDDEGFLYAQPIYFAPADNWDLEFVPQTRAKRGDGLYTTYRYADSAYSRLLIKTGTFKEKEEYLENNSLENDIHYGFNLDYSRNNIFENDSSNDELSIWLEGMNDIEYRNLDNDNIASDGESTSYGTSRLSYVNYYYDTSKWYNGVYFKYYLNTAIDDNGVTLQQLPQYQSHFYTDSLFLDKLIYSTDIMFTNYSREDGITAKKTDLNLPVSYEFALFDDYLFVELKEDTTISNIQYGLEEDQDYKDGNYIRSTHQVSLSTDLIKPYKDIAHSINLGIDYSIPNIYKQSGEIYNLTSTDSDLSSFSFTKDKKSLTVSAKNYFYDIESKKLLLSDFLSQSYEYKNDGYTPTNLENTLTINYSLGTISNRVIYNQEDKEYILSSSSFSLTKDKSNLAITHYRTKKTKNTSYAQSESMTFSTALNFAKNYTLTYSNSYNILNEESSKEVYALEYDEKCWSLEFRIEDSLVTSSSTTSSAVRQDIYYLTFDLKPLGGYVYKYKMDEREE